MDRPKRERRPPQTYQPEIVNKNIKGYWSLPEKEKLFEAIKKHGRDDINRLERALRPKKTKAQIAHYLQILEKRQPKKTTTVKEEAPIETWLRLSNELTANDADYSDVLANVVSICGNLEPHLPSKKASEVDYPAIYRYLECILRGNANFPHMNELTAAILLDVLQSMAETLKTLDLGVQRRLMAEKYKLLKGKVSINNPNHYEAARKALENDIELNGVMAMTERIPYPHQVAASPQRFSRWNKRTATPVSSTVTAAPVTPGTAASTSAMAAQGSATSAQGSATAAQGSATSAQAAAAVVGQPAAKRVKLLPGVKITPGTYKLSPQDLQALLKSLSLPVPPPAPGAKLQSPPAPTCQAPSLGATLPSPPVPAQVPNSPPSGAQVDEKKDGIQGSTGGDALTKVQSGAKQMSPGTEEPQVDLQSGAKQVSQSIEVPQGDLQSGAKQVSQGTEEPQGELQSGAKQVSPDNELQSTMPSGAKDTQEQTGEESQTPNAANCGVTVQSDAAHQNTPSRTAESVTVQNDSNQNMTPNASASQVTVQTNITPSGSTNVTEPVLSSPDGIHILDKVVVSTNQVRGISKAAAKLPKRTSLFSLNPLCVPVRYLKPNKIQTAAFGGMVEDTNV